METTRISCRTSLVLVITLQQIQAVISVMVAGMEGQTFDFRCDYGRGWENNAKYFCRVEDDDSSTALIRADKHDEWKRDGRFSLYDNTTAAFFTVRLEKLTLSDSGTYWCGVDVSLRPDHISIIQLNVSQTNEILTRDQKGHKLSLQLFLTAVMCSAAVVFVCLFSCCLLLTVKHQRSGSSQRRKTSSDYEIMMPGVKTEPELCCRCSAAGRLDVSAFPPDDFSPKQRESALSLSRGEYVDVEAPGRLGQYQHLDLSQREEHVYHSLYENSCPKHGNSRMCPLTPQGRL